MNFSYSACRLVSRLLSCFSFPVLPGLLLIPSQQRTEIIELFRGNLTIFRSYVCPSRQTPLELPRTVTDGPGTRSSTCYFKKPGNSVTNYEGGLELSESSLVLQNVLFPQKGFREVTDVIPLSSRCLLVPQCGINRPGFASSSGIYLPSDLVQIPKFL